LELTFKCFVHFFDENEELPFEDITYAQKEHLIQHGTTAFMKEVGIKVINKSKRDATN